MIQPLNYCRQMVRQFRDLLAVPGFSGDAHRLGQMIDLAGASHKFLMPDGGRLLDDLEFRGIDDDETLRLPMPFVALEWHIGGRNAPPKQGESACPKRILFAREGDDGVIRCTPVIWLQENGTWVPMYDFGIPMRGALGAVVDSPLGPQRSIKPLFSRPTSQFNVADYEDEIGCIIGFLNALRCSNVSSDRMVSSAKSAQQAHKFDSYHILTIDSPSGKVGAGGQGHRSPREHLRRGHIRRLQTGSRIWVNATVVAAGRGAGVVTKDYGFRPAVTNSAPQLAHHCNLKA
jgi:hypothetical protein